MNTKVMKFGFSAFACAVTALAFAFRAPAATSWAHDASAGTITDGRWVLSVNWVSESGALTVTGVKSGSGALDLRDATVDGAEVGEIRLKTSLFVKNTAITAFYANHLAGSLDRLFYAATNLERIEIAGEGVTEIASSKEGEGDGCFEGCTALASIVLDCPNLTYIGKYAFARCSNLSGDIGDIVNPNVRTIEDRAFQDCRKLTGRLCLRSADYLGTSVFYCGYGAQDAALGVQEIRLGKGQLTNLLPHDVQGLFEHCTELTNFVVEADSLTIGRYAFANCSGLRRIEFVVPEPVVFSEKDSFRTTTWTFAGCSSLNEVVFAGAAPTSDGLDTLLTAVAASDADKTCTIYASKKQTGWLEIAAPLTDGEKAVAPANCFGVYRDGSRKAWLVQYASPFDPEESGAVVVRANPEGYGSPNVPYGTYGGVTPGTEFSVAPWYKTNGKLYRCVGYVLEELNETEWSVAGSGESCSWKYALSEKMQRLTWQFELAGGELNLQVPVASSVTVTPEPIFDGCYTNGTPMTLVAHDFAEMPRADFVCWYGENLPVGIDTAAKTIAFPFDDTLDFGARYRGYDWIYDETTRTLTARNWKLRVESFDAESGTLVIGSCLGGLGEIDLRDVTVNGVLVRELRLKPSLFAGNTAITAFYANHLAGSLDRLFYAAKNLERVEIAGEGVTEIASSKEGNGDGCFDQCSALVSMTLDCPNLTYIGKYAFAGCSNLSGDIADIVNPNVRTIEDLAFKDCRKLTGRLCLRSVDYLGTSVFYCSYGAQAAASGVQEIRLGKGQLTNLLPHDVQGLFEHCTELTNFVVEADSLTIGRYAFVNCSGLRRIEFVVPEPVVFSEKDSFGTTTWTFPGCTSLEEVVFAGAAPTSDGLDTLLTAVAASDANKTCTIYASKKQPGWKELAAPLTDEELKVAPVGCFGVYRDGLRKAWLVHRNSPFDPTGMTLLVI